jgi:hypothetical protein
MDARRVSTLVLVLTVPVSSLLGLARPMSKVGAQVFGDVWTANLWGDLIFTGGTLAAGWAAARLVQRLRPSGPSLAAVAAVPVAFLLHWAVYACAWTFTGANDGFLDPSPHGFGRAWAFTFEWGWIGLLAMAAMGPALAWSQGKAERQAPAPAAT